MPRQCAERPLCRGNVPSDCCAEAMCRATVVPRQCAERTKKMGVGVGVRIRTYISSAHFGSKPSSPKNK